MCFSGNNMLTTNARKLIKGSKLADVHLSYFERKNKEITPYVFFQAHDDIIKNPLNPTHSWHHPKKSSNPKVHRFFQTKPRRLSASLEGLLYNSLALLVGKLWLDKLKSTKVALRSLKGSTTISSMKDNISFRHVLSKFIFNGIQFILNWKTVWLQ